MWGLEAPLELFVSSTGPFPSSLSVFFSVLHLLVCFNVVTDWCESQLKLGCGPS